MSKDFRGAKRLPWRNGNGVGYMINEVTLHLAYTSISSYWGG